MMLILTRRGEAVEIVLALIIGSVIVAMIARSRGRSALPWLFYGVLLFPIALVHALLLRQAEGTMRGFGPPPETPRRQPYFPSSTNSPSGRVALAALSDGSSGISDALDAETLKVSGEWRAAERQFTMIEAKEEARLRLLEKSTQSPKATAKIEGKKFDPDPLRNTTSPEHKWKTPPLKVDPTSVLKLPSNWRT